MRTLFRYVLTATAGLVACVQPHACVAQQSDQATISTRRFIYKVVEARAEQSRTTSKDSKSVSADDAPSSPNKSAPGRQLHIDMTLPPSWQSNDQRPAVVFFHGGGWVSGKPGQFEHHSEELAKLGLVCFRVEYRLLDKANNDPPEICVEDATDAIQYVRLHANELGVAPHRIAAGGGSAGGHLAAYLGMMDDVSEPTSRKPQALLLFNPVYDNGPDGWGTARVGKRYAEFSPLHNISKDDPPAIVFLGTADKLIPVTTAREFQQQMRDAGLVSELRLYTDQAHGFFNYGRDDNRWYRDTMQESIAFLRDLGWIEADRETDR